MVKVSLAGFYLDSYATPTSERFRSIFSAVFFRSNSNVFLSASLSEEDGMLAVLETGSVDCMLRYQLQLCP